MGRKTACRSAADPSRSGLVAGSGGCPSRRTSVPPRRSSTSAPVGGIPFHQVAPAPGGVGVSGESGWPPRRSRADESRAAAPRPPGVAAAAGRHPATLAELVGQVVQGQVRRTLPVDGHEMGQRVLGCESQPCWVTSTSGVNGAQQRRHDGVERAQPAGVAGARRQRHVDRAALGARAAGLRRGSPVPGTAIAAGLVQADRQHPRVVVEDRLRRRRRGGRRRRRRRPARRRGPAASGSPTAMSL